MAVEYLYPNEPIELSRYCREYIFKAVGSQAGLVGVVINGGWHEANPSLGWRGDAKEIIPVAKEFLERALDGGWVPTSSDHRLEIPDEEMEYLVRCGAFSR